MTYETSSSLIPGVVSVVDIRKEIMNIVELVLKMSGAICMMCIFVTCSSLEVG